METSSKTEVEEAMETGSIQQIKLPPFYKNNPKLWFLQVESQFFVSKIKNDTAKYHMVIGIIDTEVLQQVSDILSSLPQTERYETLKQTIIQRFSESDNQKIRKLLKDMELGDRKPSHLLREMKNLAEGKVTDDLVKTLWLQRLPEQVQMVLTTNTLNLVQMAEIADKLMEIQQPQICAISPTTSNTEIIKLQQQLQQQQQQMNQITKMLEKLEYNSSNPRWRRRSRSRSTSGMSTVCFYHEKFGDNAKKCKVGCSKYNQPKQSEN